MKSITKWLKSQAKYIFWVYLPVVSTFIFAILMEHFLPDSGMLPVALFALTMLSIAALLS